MDHYAYNDHPGNPVNHLLLSYTGAEGPGLWLLQVQALCQAHQTLEDQRGLSMVTLVARKTLGYGYFKCKRCSKRIRHLTRSKAFGC